ncbi:alpha-L-fucosidase [Chitinophaga sp. 2R12]|uniref:alpha-L-fucosidase n=2 Tax=Chitinophagaceae TaxID=563835 RepID=A0ABS5IYZ4_9BACT|nr:alpha-L-fucosidase [Chitinophaga hostae]
MDEMWDKNSTAKEHPNIQWFKDAKFGLFIHWGLYSQLAGKWNNKRYYGSGEWIMFQAGIPVKEYEQVAKEFNPVNFNADEWAQLAKDAGIKYMVITAKHHEGFAMYDSKASDFNIVEATPYKKDPMKALADATRKRGIKFGFYYSQFVDWHEPNGAGNERDFDESKKNYQLYYDQKAIPQLKELLTGYGPLGIVWFDLPGGLTKAETQKLIDSLHALQPQSLFSSRVGQGLGDYKDFGDSEVPPVPIKGAWESIYTHNDSWGYIEHDMNFKTSTEIIQLLANVASKGGNLMLNVGPDGKGNIPFYSIKYLKETGKWLAVNGESIYGTTYGFIPAQPWGVTTAKPGKLFLHVLNKPQNGKLLVPDFTNQVSNVYALDGKRKLNFKRNDKDIVIDIPSSTGATANNVLVIEYSGAPPAYNATSPVTVSQQYETNRVDAIFSTNSGKAKTTSLGYSHYFGDWKHATCVTSMATPDDAATFQIRITDPGDYKVILEYACSPANAGQEASLEMAGEKFFFKTLRTSEYSNGAPLLFIQHPVAITKIERTGVYSITIRPDQKGSELFKLKRVILEPAK